jgi:hypothetical protein
VVWYCLNWALGPLDRAAKNRQFPIQFGLADLLCLFVLVQLPVGILHWATRDSAFPARAWVMDIVLGGIATVTWWTCVRTLSRAGIQVVWQRCVVLTVILPCSYVGSISVIALPIVATDLLAEQQSSVGSLLLLAEIAAAAILYGLGRFTRVIVASAKNEE